MRNNQYGGNNLLALTNGSSQARKVTEQFIDRHGGIDKLRDSKDWPEVSEEFIQVLRSTPVEQE